MSTQEEGITTPQDAAEAQPAKRVVKKPLNAKSLKTIFTIVGVATLSPLLYRSAASSSPFVSPIPGGTVLPENGTLCQNRPSSMLPGKLTGEVAVRNNSPKEAKGQVIFKGVDFGMSSILTKTIAVGAGQVMTFPVQADSNLAPGTKFTIETEIFTGQQGGHGSGTTKGVPCPPIGHRIFLPQVLR